MIEFIPAVTECLDCGWEVEGDQHRRCGRDGCGSRRLFVYQRECVMNEERVAPS